MRNTLKTLGSSTHTNEERSKLDYYGTDPRSTQALLNCEKFDKNIWEPCAGHHLISNVLEKNGYKVKTTDIADYGFGDEQIDLFYYNGGVWNGDIITNPPYALATDMIEILLNNINDKHKLAMFLRIQYLEGISRFERIFKNNPPKTIYVFINRQTSSKEDDFNSSSAVAYAWYVWEKGFKGDPSVKWISSNNKISLF